jgi:hypothetical protein
MVGHGESPEGREGKGKELGGEGLDTTVAVLLSSVGL